MGLRWRFPALDICYSYILTRKSHSVLMNRTPTFPCQRRRSSQQGTDLYGSLCKLGLHYRSWNHPSCNNEIVVYELGINAVRVGNGFGVYRRIAVGCDVDNDKCLAFLRAHEGKCFAFLKSALIGSGSLMLRGASGRIIKTYVVKLGSGCVWSRDVSHFPCKLYSNHKEPGMTPRPTVNDPALPVRHLQCRPIVRPAYSFLALFSSRPRAPTAIGMTDGTHHS